MVGVPEQGVCRGWRGETEWEAVQEQQKIAPRTARSSHETTTDHAAAQR